MNCDDRNRLHIDRGCLMSVRKGDVIAKGLFVVDQPLPCLEVKHPARDPIHRVEILQSLRDRVSQEMMVQSAFKAKKTLTQLASSLSMIKAKMTESQQSNAKAIIGCHQVVLTCMAAFM